MLSSLQSKWELLCLLICLLNHYISLLECKLPESRNPFVHLFNGRLSNENSAWEKKQCWVNNMNRMSKHGHWYYNKHYWYYEIKVQFSSVQFSRSVMSNSLLPDESQHASPPCPSPTPGVHSTHVHRVGDAIETSGHLSSPSPPAPNPSQHQSLFQWVKSSHEVAKVLEFQLQYQSFQRTPRTDLL